MALSKAKSGLKMALASVAAVGFVAGSAMAEDAPKTQFSTASTSNASATLSQAQIDRLSVEGAAADYAASGYGKIGVAVLKGPDTGELTGSRLAAGFETGFETKFSMPEAEGFSGDNGSKNTEITFFYRLATDDPNEVAVLSDGPFNFGDALEYMSTTVTAVQGTLKYASSQDVSYIPDAP